MKNGKAPGLDMILNEYIKSTSSIFLPIYEKLFNAILDTGHFPEQWSTGCIHPIYKNKGDKDNVKNYRPITILSCLGKLFTSVLNSRLNDYLEESFVDISQTFDSDKKVDFYRFQCCFEHELWNRVSFIYGP